MNIQLLQWGLVSFLIGLLVSLPVAAVHYGYGPAAKWTKVFINYRKLLSAHLDFFTQAFAAGFAYLLGAAMNIEFPAYVLIPLIYGMICNPSILLFEATALRKSKITKLLRATSPISLYFAWFYIAYLVLPLYMVVMSSVLVAAGALLIFTSGRKAV
ncbi:hypothetical protein [Paenibacillus thermotolerans]|uniref:hypothetical protein n=1 Tax=Paenibacillus thermotolerans TaxID=3027807 RepID=UPI0023679294|nr:MULTISPECIES: hypothetical protein [unclassified Paenibacillus]